MSGEEVVESRVDPLSENGMIPQGSISQEPKHTHSDPLTRT